MRDKITWPEEAESQHNRAVWHAVGATAEDVTRRIRAAKYRGQEAYQREYETCTRTAGVQARDAPDPCPLFSYYDNAPSMLKGRDSGGSVDGEYMAFSPETIARLSLEAEAWAEACERWSALACQAYESAIGATVAAAAQDIAAVLGVSRTAAALRAAADSLKA